MSETTARALQLLGLLQARSMWSGPELAERLGVTTRTVRRDVDRLRELGYPVSASQGVGGGYQLGTGAALPPLLLDDEEAVAVAVSLRLAAGGTVAGVGEAALRTIAKLDQVLPARLRAHVDAVQAATVTLDRRVPLVDGSVITILARAARDRAQATFTYADRSGRDSERRVEPYRLVATGVRWYLLAWDLEREDWRTFRLDRMRDVRASTWRFRPREAPDPAAYVQRGITVEGYAVHVRLRVHAPAARVAERLPSTVATVEPEGGRAGRATCIVTIGVNSVEDAALNLPRLGLEFDVLDPPELRSALGVVAERLSRAVGGRAGNDATDAG